jgi:hypothetical protein
MSVFGIKEKGEFDQYFKAFQEGKLRLPSMDYFSTPNLSVLLGYEKMATMK